MSDELNPYPGNMKQHRVEPIVGDDELQRIALGYYTKEQARKSREAQHIYNASYVAAHKLRDIYEAARAKDAEEIAKWKGIVKGVHGALNDIGTVPVPAMDADLYDAVMAIRAKDAELIQTLVDALHGLQFDDGNVIPAYHKANRAIEAAFAFGYKPTNP